MKYYLTIFILMLALMLQAFDIRTFDESKAVPNVLIVAFNASSIGTTRGEINVTRNRNNQIAIGRDSFDQIATENDFVNIERMFMVNNYEWRDTNGTHIMNIFRITLRDNNHIERALYALSNDPNVLWTEFEGIIEDFSVPTDTVNSHWNFRNDIQLPNMWNYLTIGSDVIVAIVDNGVKWNHTYLRNGMYVDNSQLIPFGPMTINMNTGALTGPFGSSGTITPINPNTYNVNFWGDVIGWDFFGNTNKSFQSFGGVFVICPVDIRDANGNLVKQHPNGNCTHIMDHGTHVAGIVRATIGNSSIAQNIKLLPTRQRTDQTFANTGDANIGFRSIIYAVNKGARVINCSWGGADMTNLSNTVVNFATDNGSLVIAGAGNNTSSALFYPAASTNAIAVAASEGNNRASFSNFGNWIDIIAPGVNIRSSSFNVSGADNYVDKSGTSMAAPIVSGIAAAMFSINPNLTPLQVKSIITNSNNTDRFGQFGGIPNAGRVNALKAVQAATPVVITTVRTITNPAELVDKHFLVTNGGRLVVAVGNAQINAPYGSITVDGSGSQMYFEQCSHPSNRIGNLNVRNGGLLSIYDYSNLFIIDGAIDVSGHGSVFQLWNQNELTLVRTQVNISNNASFTVNNQSQVNLWDRTTVKLQNNSNLITHRISTFLMSESTLEMSGHSYVRFQHDSLFQTYQHNYIIGNTAGVWNTNVSPSVPIVWGDRIEIDRSSLNFHRLNTVSSGSGAVWDGFFFNETHRRYTTFNNGDRSLFANISNIRYIRLEDSELEIINSNINNIRQISSLSDSILNFWNVTYENNQYGIFVDNARSLKIDNSTIRNNGSSGVSMRFSTSPTNQILRSWIYNNALDGVNLSTSYVSINNTEIRNNARDGISSIGSVASVVSGSTRVYNNYVADVFAPANHFLQFVNGGTPSMMVGTLPGTATISRAFLEASGVSSIPSVPGINLHDLAINVVDVFKFLPCINCYQINHPLRGYDRVLYMNAIEFVLDEKFEDAFDEFMRLLELAPESEFSYRAVTYLPALHRELDIDVKELYRYFEILNVHDNLRDIAQETVALTKMFNNEFRESILHFHDILSKPQSSEQTLLYELYQAYSYFKLSEMGEINLPKVARLQPTNSSEFEEIYDNIMKQLNDNRNIKMDEDFQNDNALSAKNYPNPFNPETTINFVLPVSSNVLIDIYNIRGQKVRSFLMDNMLQGAHSVVWNGTDANQRNVGSGVYFYRIQAGELSYTNHMILMK